MLLSEKLVLACTSIQSNSYDISIEYLFFVPQTDTDT